MIKIGPAGTRGSSEEGFLAIKKAGLDAVEIEFTYSVWMKKDQLSMQVVLLEWISVINQI